MRKLGIVTAATALVAAVGFAGAANATFTYPFDTDLVGYWPFDVNGADPTADASVNSNTGTLGNALGGDVDDPAYDCTVGNIAPAPGNVCSLDFGAGDFVRVADTTDLEPTDVTVSVWVRNNGAPTSFDYILAKTRDGGKASYALYTGGSSGLFFYASNAGAFFPSDNAGSGIWDGSWHHIAGVYDSSGPTVRLFVDGTEVGTANAGPAAIDYVTGLGFGDFTVGTYNDQAPTFDWIGNIDEARVYDVALTGDEIGLLATGFTVEKEIVSTTDNGDGDNILELFEEWEFVMEVTITNLGPGNLTGLMVKDPLPGDLQLGTNTACTNIVGEFVTAPVGNVMTSAKGKTEKCFVEWNGFDVDAGDPAATMTITATTDENPAEHQEYTSAGPYCINQGASLEGTIVSGSESVAFSGERSNGLEADGGVSTIVVTQVNHDDCD